jgi:transcriptional regulator with XRE-family HTH domain
MTGARPPASHPSSGNPEQTRLQDEIAAAKRQLAQRFRAWRIRAGLTQDGLAGRTGYKRAAIHNAERGTSRSRPLFEAADKATGARGALLAERDRIDAAIKAARQEAARRARAALARQTGPSLDMSDAALGTVALVNLRCPHCNTSLSATLGIHVTLTTPITGAEYPGE